MPRVRGYLKGWALLGPTHEGGRVATGRSHDMTTE